MNAKEIAAQEVAQYLGVSPASCIYANLTHRIARLIHEAEERGYARAKAELAEATKPHPAVPGRHLVIGPGGATVDGVPVSPPFEGMPDLCGCDQGIPCPRGKVGSQDRCVTDQAKACDVPAPTSYTITLSPISTSCDAPAKRRDVPLFVYFEGDDGSEGALDARFVPPADVAEQLAGEFVCQRPVGIGFRDGTGNSHEVTMADPANAPRVVEYVRNAVRNIVNDVIAERDTAWAVALAEAGFDTVPLSPDAVGDAVEQFEAVTESARDGEWCAAMREAGAEHDCIVSGTSPNTIGYVIRTHRINAVAVERKRLTAEVGAAFDSIEKACAAAARRARRQERSACCQIAVDHGKGLIEQMKSGGFFARRRFRRRAETAIDIAEAIIVRAEQDVPAPDQANARPVPRGSAYCPA